LIIATWFSLGKFSLFMNFYYIWKIHWLSRVNTVEWGRTRYEG
jgi:hypothetical protein